MNVADQAAWDALEAARELVRSRRWFLDLDADRDLPEPLAAALDRALRTLDAAADR
ncbi:hypothetical protein MEX01_23770 [Methylorubrum extorquens]|uniref:hypothetical protein n=1 Tax=Methylorubrum extorquens TaxID=408 RepID=UPI00116FC2A3|nr:hypothetical protein [Methylorubrum extorquens]GEL41786.1 hypothetical protein MEX01_23770 [Methylorubrum extorquens]